MKTIVITRQEFLNDKQGRTFADVFTDSERAFEKALAFFNDADRQRRMEESEIHHDRAPLAGVVRELESLPEINQILGADEAKRNQRLRQAIGVLVRLIMERRGWKKTGKKGSLGVRSARIAGTPNHNTGGLAFWFLRAERYEPAEGLTFLSVRKRCRALEKTNSKSTPTKRHASNGRARGGSDKPGRQHKSPKST